MKYQYKAGYMARLARVWEKSFRTDGRTETPSYRDARTHLKSDLRQHRVCWWQVTRLKIFQFNRAEMFILVDKWNLGRVKHRHIDRYQLYAAFLTEWMQDEIWLLHVPSCRVLLCDAFQANVLTVDRRKFVLRVRTLPDLPALHNLSETHISSETTMLNSCSSLLVAVILFSSSMLFL